MKIPAQVLLATAVLLFPARHIEGQSTPPQNPPPQAIKASDFAPPPIPVWPKMTKPVPSVDLNGTWEMQVGKPHTYDSLYIKLEVFQIRHAAVGFVLEGLPYPLPGESYFNADFNNSPSPNPLIGSIWEKTGDIQDDKLEVVQDANIIVDNEDQFHIDKVGTFHRLTRATAQDLPCDPKNPLHISAKEALYRGSIYQPYKSGGDSASCWFYISAMQGNAKAMGLYSYNLYVGDGIQKDLKQSFWWAQQGAMRGDYYSQHRLALEFRDGETAPLSISRSYYWGHMAGAKSPSYINMYEEKSTMPDWTLQTSGPCDPANPTHADDNRAYISGRVAYQARALATAACWFTISASYNNLRAQVYLGILYLYGFGVAPDPPKGFAYMKKAAEGGDPFGKAYLSMMYRYGMGTPVDANQSSYWFTQAVGSSAWDAVMSRRSIEQMTANAAESQPDISKDIADCQQRMYKDYRMSVNDAKEACSSVSPFDVLSFGRASGRNTMMMPEEIYPEGLPYTYP